MHLQFYFTDIMNWFLSITNKKFHLLLLYLVIFSQLKITQKPSYVTVRDLPLGEHPCPVWGRGIIISSVAAVAD